MRRTLFSTTAALLCCGGLADGQNESARQPADRGKPAGDIVVPDQLIPDRIASGLVKGPVFRFALHNLSYSPDGTTLAAGSGSGMVYLWDLSRKKKSIEMHAVRVQAHKDWAFSIAWTADSSQLITGGGDNLIRLYNVDRVNAWYRSKKSIGIGRVYPDESSRLFKGHTQDVHAVALTSDEKWLVSVGDDRQAIVWDFNTGKLVRRLSGHEKQIPTVAVSPDDSLVATGSRDHSIRLWDLATGKLVRKIEGHSADVMSVRFSPDGKSLASASYDGTVRTWDVTTGLPKSISKGHTKWVFSVAFSPDGKTIASAGDNTVRLWDAATGAQIWTTALKRQIVTKTKTVNQHAAFVAFAPSGNQVAVAATGGGATLLSAKDGKVERSILAWGRLPK